MSRPLSAERYVELGATPKARGRVLRKHILNLGDLRYKGRTLTLDDAWYDQLKRNFESGVSTVQVPLANTGEVVGLERQGSKVYTLIDVRDPDAAQRIADGRILGASAYLHLDYEDTRNGKKVGPAPRLLPRAPFGCNTPFPGDAEFEAATFGFLAWFIGATFSGSAMFGEVTFSSKSRWYFDRSRVLSPDAEHVWPTGWCLGPDGNGGYTVARANDAGRS